MKITIIWDILCLLENEVIPIALLMNTAQRLKRCIHWLRTICNKLEMDQPTEFPNNVLKVASTIIRVSEYMIKYSVTPGQKVRLKWFFPLL